MTTPLFMRDVSLTLKLLPAGPTRVEYNCDVHLAEVTVKPGADVSYQTLCPDGSFANRGASTYALHVVAAQDWSAEGLARFLWDHDGETAEAQYQAHGSAAIPPTADTPGMVGVVTLQAPSYGGEADKYAELDVTLPYTSKPTIATAAFPTLEEGATEEPAA